MSEIDTAIDMVCGQLDGAETPMDYDFRHGIKSLSVLTVTSLDEAVLTVNEFADEITGKRVVEIGAGVGYLSIAMARVASSVVAIECCPAWSWVFTKYLYRMKPSNLTWIFGSAESVAGFVRADVAVIRTYSGLRHMIAAAEQMAPRIVLSFDQGWQSANRGDPVLSRIALGVDDDLELRRSGLNAARLSREQK